MKLKYFLAIGLLLSKISTTDIDIRDGEALELDLNAHGKRKINFLIDGQNLSIPLTEPKLSLAEKKGIPEQLFEQLKQRAKNRLRRRDTDFEYINNIKELKRGPNFVLRMEHLPISHSILDPKYDRVDAKRRFDSHRCLDQVKTHVLGLYRIVKKHEKGRNLGKVLDDTKFAESWVNRFLQDQKHLLAVNGVNSSDERYKILDLTGNTFKNMYKSMRNDYSQDKTNFKTYKRYLKAINLLMAKIIPPDSKKNITII